MTHSEITALLSKYYWFSQMRGQIKVLLTSSFYKWKQSSGEQALYFILCQLENGKDAKQCIDAVAQICRSDCQKFTGFSDDDLLYRIVQQIYFYHKDEKTILPSSLEKCIGPCDGETSVL